MIGQDREQNGAKCGETEAKNVQLLFVNRAIALAKEPICSAVIIE